MQAITLTIADVLIRRDTEGRYNLNDLHKAAGAEKRHQPANWLRMEQTQALIAELSDPQIRGSLSIAPINSAKGKFADGTPQGTYVCKELVYSYAMWISASFHLRVIRSYDAQVTALPNALRQLPETLTPAEQQGLQELVSARTAEWGPAKGKVMAEIWSRVHRKFHVAKYEQLTRDQLPAVTTYILTMELRTPRPALDAPDGAPPATASTSTAAVHSAINRKAWTLAHDAYDLCRDGLTQRVAYVAATEAQALKAVTEATLSTVLAPRVTEYVETVQTLAAVLADIATSAHQKIAAEVRKLSDST